MLPSYSPSIKLSFMQPNARNDAIMKFYEVLYCSYWMFFVISLFTFVPLDLASRLMSNLQPYFKLESLTVELVEILKQ